MLRQAGFGGLALGLVIIWALWFLRFFKRVQCLYKDLRTKGPILGARSFNLRYWVERCWGDVGWVSGSGVSPRFTGVGGLLGK